MRKNLSKAGLFAFVLVQGNAALAAYAPGDDYLGWGDQSSGKVLKTFADGADGLEWERLANVLVRPDGSSITVGRIRDNPNAIYRIGLEKLTPTGAHDAAFGTYSGFAASNLDDGHLPAIGATLDPQGHVIAVTRQGRICRFNGDSGLPMPFNNSTAHCIVKPWGNLSNVSIEAIASVGGGKIVLIGNQIAQNTSNGFVTRLLSDGTPDPAFGTGGVSVFLPADVYWLQFHAVAETSNGKLAIAGEGFNNIDGTDTAYLMRLSANGLADAWPTAQVNPDDLEAAFYGIAAVDNPNSTEDDIVAVGTAGNSGLIARFDAVKNEIIHRLVSYDENKWLIFGNVAVADGRIIALSVQNWAVIARFLPDLTSDISFAQGGFRTLDIDGGDGGIQSGDIRVAALAVRGDAAYAARLFSFDPPAQITKLHLHDDDVIFANGFELN